MHRARTNTHTNTHHSRARAHTKGRTCKRRLQIGERAKGQRHGSRSIPLVQQRVRLNEKERESKRESEKERETERERQRERDRESVQRE